MHFFTASDGARLAFQDQGQGQAMLCLPGLTRNMDDFEPVVQAFSGRARIIRLDYRGRGASDFTGAETYTIPREAQDVMELLDHLDIAKTAILGTSRGGLIAMALAIGDKPRLSGVILNDIGPEIMMQGLADIRDYIGLPPQFETMKQAINALPARYAPAFQNVPAQTWADHARALYRETPDGLALRYDPALRDAVMAAFQPDAPPIDFWPGFEALDGLPLGLIRGQNSNILSPKTAADMRRRRPDMVFCNLADRGHVPFLNEAQAQALISNILEVL